LQEENDLLKLEVQSLQVAFQTSSDKVQQLEEKLKALAVAKSLEESEVDREAINEKILDTKQKINDFVREIDRCIGIWKEEEKKGKSVTLFKGRHNGRNFHKNKDRRSCFPVAGGCGRGGSYQACCEVG